MRLKPLGGEPLLKKHGGLKSLRLVVNKQRSPERFKLELCMNSKYS